MREHQIIINLKPEHYQELERLSRASGARSVSVFVKERMLISLGIGGSASSSNLPGSMNVAAVTSDLRRLHRDLQVFVAESLSGKDFGYDAGQTPSASPANSAVQLTPGAELAKAVAAAGANVLLAQPTHSTEFPSKSPETSAQSSTTPAAARPVTSTQQPITQRVAASHATTETALPDDQITLDQLAPLGGPKFSPATSSAASPAPSNQAIPRQQVEFSLRPRGSTGPFGASLSTGIPLRPSVSSSSPQITPETLSEPAPAAPEKGFPQMQTNPATTSGTSLTSAEVPDDLEELAERAFAISPRLGAMEHIDDDTPMFSDPLDELLGDIEEEKVGNTSTAHGQSAGLNPSSQSALEQEASELASEELFQELSEELSEELSGEASDETLLETEESITESDKSGAIGEFENTHIGQSAEAQDVDALGQAEGVDESVQHDLSTDLIANTGEASGVAQAASSEESDSSKTNSGANEAVAWNDTHLSQGEALGYDEEEKSSNSDDRTAGATHQKNSADASNEDNEESPSTESTDGSQGEDNTNQSGTNTGVSQNPPPISGGPPPRRRRT